jgi:hypothetical protein
MNAFIITRSHKKLNFGQTVRVIFDEENKPAFAIPDGEKNPIEITMYDVWLSENQHDYENRNRVMEITGNFPWDYYKS